VSISHVYQRGNTYYYQRKIPQDLVPRYSGKTHIKVNLKTIDPQQIARKVRDLNRQYESIWASLRGSADLQPLSIRESAAKLLGRFGLKPQPEVNDENSLDRLFDGFERKREAYAQDDLEVYYSADPEDYLDPTEVEALRMLNEEPRFVLVMLSGST